MMRFFCRGRGPDEREATRDYGSLQAHILTSITLTSSVLACTSSPSWLRTRRPGEEFRSGRVAAEVMRLPGANTVLGSFSQFPRRVADAATMCALTVADADVLLRRRHEPESAVSAFRKLPGKSLWEIVALYARALSD